jgi:hypothetical protein
MAMKEESVEIENQMANGAVTNYKDFALCPA